MITYACEVNLQIENQDENNIFNYSLEGFVFLFLKSKTRVVNCVSRLKRGN